jgi:hypothetical protein
VVLTGLTGVWSVDSRFGVPLRSRVGRLCVGSSLQWHSSGYVGLANLGSESGTCVGSRVHLVGVSISFEKNFYRLPFTPPSLVRRIGPSRVSYMCFLHVNHARQGYTPFKRRVSEVGRCPCSGLTHGRHFYSRR